MTSHYLLSFAMVALVGSGGCQSGHIQGVQTSSAGDTVVFRDSFYKQLYVADSKGVRALCRQDRRYMLSPDGRWLALFSASAAAGPPYNLVDSLCLLDLRDNKRFTTTLPVRVPDIEEPSWPERRASSSPSDNGTAQLSNGDAAAMRFGPGPQLVLGPIKGQYWAWEPENRGDTDWRQLPPGTVPEALPVSCPPAPIIDHSRGSDDQPPIWIIEMPCDGSTAPRTLWVRPDGSVLELVRKNDTPAWCAITVVSPIIGIPEALAFEAATAVVSPKMSGTMIGGVLGAIPAGWRTAFDDLKVDQDKVNQAQQELRRQVDQLRAAASSQPTTAPDR